MLIRSHGLIKRWIHLISWDIPSTFQLRVFSLSVRRVSVVPLILAHTVVISNIFSETQKALWLYFTVVVKTGKIILIARSHVFYNLLLPPVPPSDMFCLLWGCRKTKLWAGRLDITKCFTILCASSPTGTASQTRVTGSSKTTKASMFSSKKITDSDALNCHFFLLS